MHAGGDNLIEAVRADLRARPLLYRVALLLATVVMIVATVLWNGALLDAPRQLELWVDAQGAPSFDLQHQRVEVAALPFDLYYPHVVRDWDVTIDALGEANPNAWDAQVWIQAIRTPEQTVPWDAVEQGDGWQLVDSPIGAAGKALVSYGRTARSLHAVLRGSELQVVYSRNAWNGRMRVTANSEAHEVDTWREGFATGTLAIPAQPGPEDRLEGHYLSTFTALNALGAGGQMRLVTQRGEVKLLRASLDGESLETGLGPSGPWIRVPSSTRLTLLPAMGLGFMSGVAAALLIPLLWALLRRQPFWLSIAAVACLKLWLISGDEMRGSIYDGRGYMVRALDWVWGGPFGLHDYERQPIYSLIIALNRLSGLPLRMSLELLYLGGCLLLVLALPRFRVPRWAVVPAFALMALHPLTFPVFAFGYQDVAYAPVYLLALAGLLHALGTLGLPRIGWACLAGVGIALTWNTRPEHALLMGLLLLFAAAVAGVEWARLARGPAPVGMRSRFAYPLRAAMTAGLVLSPSIVFTLALTLSFAGMGRLSMGTFAVSNFQLPGFTALYTELLAIQPADPRPYWPMPKEVREKAYAASPTFARLRPHMEGPVFDTYAAMAASSTPVKDDLGVYTFWALRVAPWYMQRWESAAQLDRFYAQAASELEQARKGGLYASRSVRAPYIDPETRLWLPYLWEGMARYWRFLTRAEIELLAPEDKGVEPHIYDRAALRRAALVADNQALWTAHGHPNLQRAKSWAAQAVSLASWAGALLTLPALVLLAWRYIRRRDPEALLPPLALLLLAAALLSRYLLVSVMHAVAFGAEGRYILPVAPILPLLAVACAAWIVQCARAARQRE